MIKEFRHTLDEDNVLSELIYNDRFLATKLVGTTSIFVITYSHLPLASGVADTIWVLDPSPTFVEAVTQKSYFWFSFNFLHSNFKDLLPNTVSITGSCTYIHRRCYNRDYSLNSKCLIGPKAQCPIR